MHQPTRIAALLLAVAAIALELVAPAAAEPILPDLVPLVDEQRQYIYGGTFDRNSEPGRVLYRFNVAIGNQGEAPFQVYEETDEVAETQDVYQDVFDSEGGFTRTYLTTFEGIEGSFGHLRFQALAVYRLREILPDDGVGDVVAQYAKTSHAVVDSRFFDLTLPGAPGTPQYTSVSANPLGISVGYLDLYSKGIQEQRLDLTGVAAGEYWLEVEIDPNRHVIESDTSNNLERIKVTLELDQPVTLPGDYNADGAVDAADYTVWRDELGGAFELPNDATYGVTPSDQAQWAAAYGSAAPAVAVPEPAAWVLTLAGLGVRRRR